MTLTKFMVLLLCTTPFVVQSIQVQSGSDLTGTLEEKALQLAQEISGRGVTIKDAKFDLCDDDQVGLFTDADLQLGMKFINGIVLSSGFAADVVVGESFGSDAFGHNGYQGLTNLLPSGEGTKDACALHITFDCEDHEHFGLEFVFGSDNYGCNTHNPAKNNYDDVMGIFAQDNINKAEENNIGLYNDEYISVNSFYSGGDFVNNCDGDINIDMKGYSYPIKIDNSKQKIKTGLNELWIAVADGYTEADAVDMKKGSWLFVRRNSLVCIDKAKGGGGGPPPPGSNVRTGYRRCAQDALDSCGGLDGCRDWGCLDPYIQTQCVHPGTTRTDHHRYKQNVHEAIRSICRA